MSLFDDLPDAPAPSPRVSLHKPVKPAKRARAGARTASDGIDVDRATMHRDPANYETLITSDPIPKAEVKKKVDAIKKKYKHLTNHQALMLLIYRASSQATMLCAGDNGGGRYARYCQQIGVRY